MASFFFERFNDSAVAVILMYLNLLCSSWFPMTSLSCDCHVTLKSRGQTSDSLFVELGEEFRMIEDVVKNVLDVFDL